MAPVWQEDNMPSSPIVFNAPNNSQLIESLSGLGAGIGGILGNQQRRKMDIEEGTALSEVFKRHAANPDLGSAQLLSEIYATKGSPQRQQEAFKNYLGAEELRGRERASEGNLETRRQANDIRREALEKKSSGGEQEKPINAAAQKWAYEQIQKKDAILPLKAAIGELKEMNSTGVTGPVAGRTPTWISKSLGKGKEDAVRAAIDANAIQLLNVHRNMFPRGLTQGEFKTLSDKLVSSKNTQEANALILNAYERLADLQEKKINAVEEAVGKFGYDPNLPFLTQEIQKQFDEEESRINRELYQSVTESPKIPKMEREASQQIETDNPKTSQRQQSERNEMEPNSLRSRPAESTGPRRVKHKKSGKIMEVGPEYFQYVEQFPEEFEYQQ